MSIRLWIGTSGFSMDPGISEVEEPQFRDHAVGRRVVEEYLSFWMCGVVGFGPLTL